MWFSPDSGHLIGLFFFFGLHSVSSTVADPAVSYWQHSLFGSVLNTPYLPSIYILTGNLSYIHSYLGEQCKNRVAFKVKKPTVVHRQVSAPGLNVTSGQWAFQCNALCDAAENCAEEVQHHGLIVLALETENQQRATLNANTINKLTEQSQTLQRWVNVSAPRRATAEAPDSTAHLICRQGATRPHVQCFSTLKSSTITMLWQVEKTF